MDHVHLFFNYSCEELISDLIREIKKSSNKFINENNPSKYKFEWQPGYGVFLCGYEDVDRIIKYIKDEEAHHRKNSFKDEYFTMLDNYQIEFKKEYVFKFLD